MSVAKGFFDGKSTYTNLSKQIDVNLNFIVDATNGNGLGIRSLKSNGYVSNVFMHTSATPGSNNGVLNPNPAVGYAMVQFSNNFNRYIGGFSGNVATPASTSTTSTTAGNPYVIITLGTTTLAQWNAAGLPAGLTPTVGQAFIATATGAIGGTGTVGIPGAQTISGITIFGNPNTTIANSNISKNNGAIAIVQFLAATSSSVTTLIPTAPANNTTVGMMFRFNGSSVTVDGL